MQYESRYRPVSAVIPTAGRKERLVQTLHSVLSQEILPKEIIIVDGSCDRLSNTGIEAEVELSGVKLVLEPAVEKGAGTQRNQGISLTTEEFVWFLDDDVDLEPGCLEALWTSLGEDESIGACGCLITNQYYKSPGMVMRALLVFAGCPRKGELSGRCVGVAVNFLPSNCFGNENQVVDWLNTTCTLYRKSALPSPGFLPFFHGYSFMEDVALSVYVGENWGLRVAGEARIFHDTVPMDYKSRTCARHCMETVNRWFIATKVMNCNPWISLVRLINFQAIGILALVRKPRTWQKIPAACVGNTLGFFEIASKTRSWKGYCR